MKIEPPKLENEMEKAIIMLVDCIKENCLNPKPLILHSIRVGLKLEELNQPREVVIAGILHDLVEDTNCTTEEIESIFGKKVRDLVHALTQEKIADYKKRWRILLGKIKKQGREAMFIKIVDCLDNLNCYFHLIKNPEAVQSTLWKWRFTIKSLKPYIGDVEIFKKLENNLEKINHACVH